MDSAPATRSSFHPSSPPSYPRGFDEIKRLVINAHSILEQTPPPSLREILTAYRSKGDGDRDMLLSMLTAKTAEDQRLAAMANLNRSMLDIYQHAANSEPAHYSRPLANGAYNYPTPATYAHSPPLESQPRRAHHRHRASSRSRSPHRTSHVHSTREASTHHGEPPRKRHRSSRSPRPSHPAYESAHHAEQFPPSPYSSSSRSDSAEYSPRSRGSMTIGNLLSTGPSRDTNLDASRDRD